ncbi:hypothetical protein H4R18_004467 [Coemansia javaensis]|uniref:Uncharacterized protein n=1 Tax=Coemansia javaensis TaxID=2761396 RepID=A0A9W8LH19_9FUNG|nr:hypothetical protein H4R18_004467 [Coemansia javaensis]
MQLRDLPDDVLRLVLKASFTASDHTFKHLKKAFIGAYDHSWAPFSADDGSEAIEFPNLKKLSVMYWPVDAVYGVEARRRDDRPWKLHFPKLDMLRVSCIQDRCPLLEYAGDSIGGPAALAAANRILEGARESKERALRVKVRSPTVVPESITCTSLTALSLYVNTSVDTMLGLIQMLPDLVSLEIRCLTLSDMQEDISAPGPDEECMVEPLGSNIKEININVSPNEPASEMLVPVAKHLLLRIPTLARFCSSAILEEPIAEFVDAYSKRYPHLPGIKYMLKNKSA